MRFISSWFLLFFVSALVTMHAETLVYKEITGKDVIIDTYTVEPSPTGYHVDLISTLNGKREWICAWHTDKDFSVRRWNFQNVRENTHVAALRRGNTISLSGVHKGRKIKKTFSINSHPWKQHFPFGLESFIRSPKKSIVFWSIGTKGQGDMQAGEFYAEKKKLKTITLPDGSKEQAVYVRMNLTGFLAAFWHCDTWFRRRDGRYLRYEAINGQGNTPKTYITLTQEMK